MVEMLGYDIEDERIPALYEISYKRGTTPCIELRLHEEFVKESENIVPIECFLRNIQEKHKVGPFSPLKENNFGFDGVIKKKGKDGRGFIIYEIDIPVVRKYSGEPCKNCKGTGWSKFRGLPDRECLSCRGSGREIVYDWRQAAAISGSLQILGMMTGTFRKRTSASVPQLLTFQLACGEGMGRFPIGGYYGIDFCDWLASLPKPCQFDNVIKEMQNVYSHIFGKDDSMTLGLDFQAYIRSDSGLIISCPGNATGIFPEGSWKAGHGMEYSCHNMDTPAQQIMLLVALAILSDIIREHMEG